DAATNGTPGIYIPRIRDLPTDERPRERLQNYGASELSAAELLAIILRTGSGQHSALSLASSLLARHGGLGGLARLSFEDLAAEHGLGPAKASEIRAVFELATRYSALQPEDKPFVR